LTTLQRAGWGDSARKNESDLQVYGIRGMSQKLTTRRSWKCLSNLYVVRLLRDHQHSKHLHGFELREVIGPDVDKDTIHRELSASVRDGRWMELLS
jgi:hypothetical protein